MPSKIDEVVAVSISPQASEIKNMVLNSLEQIDRISADLRKSREMLESAYMNDQKYRECKALNKDQQKKLSVEKDRIKKMSPTIVDKVADLSKELKEIKDAMSEYLSEYVRLTGSNEIEKNDGKVLRIVRKFKIVSPGQQKLL